jgi:hypothetical protein
VKVPTGPRNAKVRLEEVFDDLEGITTRLGPKIEVWSKNFQSTRSNLIEIKIGALNEVAKCPSFPSASRRF